MARIGGVFIVAGLIAIPLVVHFAVASAWAPDAMAAVVGLQTAILTGFVVRRVRLRWLLAAALGFAVAALIWHLGGRAAVLLTGLPHAVIHATLLAVFARTLQAGEVPLVTRFIAHIRGKLPPELIAYGRRLTLAWSCYFAAQLVASAALLAFAPLATWSLFINVLSYPLLIIMFAAEYAYRRVRFRHLPRSRVADMATLLMRWRQTGVAGTPTEGQKLARDICGPETASKGMAD